MPNHITNIITIEDQGNKLLEEIRSAFVNKDGHVDFEIVIPMPECLQGFNPHTAIIDRAKAELELPISGNPLLAALEIGNRQRVLARTFSAEEQELIEKAKSNYKECGFLYWYDWSNDDKNNWGTKWNAYGQPSEGYPEDAVSFTFETAWSHPVNVIKKISEKLPEVTFSIKFADEDMGSNCGSYKVKNGSPFDDDIAPKWRDMTPEQQNKYKAFAFGIRYPGRDPREYGYDENWEYSEEIAEAYEEEQRGGER